MEMIVNEIDRLTQLSISEWKSIYKEMIPTLTHNKKQLENSENKHLVDEMVKKL
mgnify:CR=1 FL=1